MNYNSTRLCYSVQPHYSECDVCHKGCNSPFVFQSKSNTEEDFSLCNQCVAKSAKEYFETKSQVLKLNKSNCMICCNETENVIKWDNNDQQEMNMCLNCIFNSALHNHASQQFHDDLMDIKRKS